MKYYKYILFVVLIISCSKKTTITHNYLIQDRINIDFNWEFYLGDFANADSARFSGEEWRTIDLPHDWSVEGVIGKDNPSGKFGGYYPGGIAWYRKNIEWDNTWENKQVEIIFDGVYMNSDVWVNGKHLGKRPNGYIGFKYNLKSYLTKGSNIILVRVDNSKQPSGRWYTGCGIYRHVWLDIKNDIHIPESGTFVTYEDIDSTKATIHVATEINNLSKTDKSLSLETIIVNKDNEEVSKAIKNFNVINNKSTTITQRLDVKKPNLWSTTNPYLYKVETIIKDEDVIIDRYTTNIGIRSTKIDSQTGFLLNGVNTKLKGICMHHAAGSLGSAVPEDVLERRLKLLKTMGCNAIRTSHNPFSPEFYNMCDSLGILVLNEAFDGWDKTKAKYDYGLYFNEWWKRDLTDFIKRDRNHPSVIMWSIGNEVKKRNESVETLLVDLVHKLDPTRLVTIGASHDAKIVDVAGFNGHGEFPGALEKVHKDHPDWPIIGTEVPHSWQTRGVYRTKTWYRGRDFPAPWSQKLSNKLPPASKYFPIPDLTKEEVFTGINPNYLSSYDNATVRISAREQWKRTNKFDWFLGEFRWTGFDYLGENIWPNRGWHCGVMDLAGFKKDHYYFYQSVWTEKPMVHILPHWTHPGKEGVEIPVVVYSNCDEVELFLNDKSLGTKTNTSNDLRMLWYVPYKSGKLKAVARNNGNVVSKAEHITSGKPYALKLVTDKVLLLANKRSVAHITVKVVDEQGDFVPYANVPFTYKLDGPAKILGIENGDMLDLSKNLAPVKKTFNGLSLIYVQSNLEALEVELTVQSKGLKGGKIKLQIKLDKS